MRTPHRSLWALALLSSTALSPLVVLSPRTAHAQAPDDAARSNARQLATEASEAYRAGQCDMAYDRFNRAFELVNVPALGVWSARSLEQGGRLVEASERYRQVLAIQLGASPAPADLEAQQNARAELDELLPRIPNLTIQLQNAAAADVEVTLDGKRVPTALLGVKQRVNPGKHHLEARRDDEFYERDVTLGERGAEEVSFEFQQRLSEPEALSGAQARSTEASGFDGRTVGFVSLGLGAAFLATGIVTGVMGLDQESRIKDFCPDGACDPASVTREQLSELDTMRTLSTLSFIGAGVFGGLGLTLVLVGGDDPAPRAQTAPRGLTMNARLTPTSVQFAGTF